MSPLLQSLEALEALVPTSTMHTRVVEIGGVAITLRTSSLPFARMVEERYAGFITRQSPSESLGRILFDIEVLNPPQRSLVEMGEEPEHSEDEELQVVCENGIWRMRRGDFTAEWDAKSGCGQIRQAVNPYALDSILRIVHSLVLARQGEFLVHAASAIRNGRAFLFAGVSGSGKTTISRLAPPDATLLTDEISYVRKDTARKNHLSQDLGNTAAYRAFGTPFTGELARLGTNCSAPLHALYLLSQGPENRIDEIPPAQATQSLLRNILFFAHDAAFVQCVFNSACEFVQRVPVRRLTFRKDASVWDLIG